MKKVITKNTSLAVKYRPQTFEDVVGQENVITILKNQLEQGNTKQGYLFTGGAGTGKTTIARIFARELNGGNPNSDIIEIDAASNNGVDQIRELRESCKFKPISSKYKVYIIDEVK
jgi:DNA polymerase III subunit gamma/tau